MSRLGSCRIGWRRWVLFASLQGCSLMGLAENLGGESCEAKERSFCGVLNEIEPTGEACLTWQCRLGECVRDIRDDDGDGAPNSMCVPMGDPIADCDDANASNAPSLTEVCNGVDDDCDARVDEDAVSVLSSSLGVALGASDIEPLAYDTTPDTSELFALYGTPDSGTRLALLRSDLDSSAPRHDAVSVLRGTSSVSSNYRGLALAALGGGRMVVAMVPDGCQRLVLGLASVSSGSPTLLVEQSHFESGLTKRIGSCAGGDTAPVAMPAVVASGDAVLAAWLEAPDAGSAARECGAVVPAPVLVSGARIASDELEIPERAARSIGRSVDWMGPAVVPFEGAFYVAFVEETERSIVVHRVRGADPVEPERVHQEGMSGAAGEVHLALGARCEDCESPSVRVALAWAQGGCGSEARVGLRFLELDSEGMARPAGAAVVLDGEASAPRLAYREGRWVVVARRRDILVAAVLDANGAVLAPFSELGPASGGRAHLAAAGRERAFVAVGWDRGQDAGEFHGVGLGCVASTD